jgi:hypothetical protein
LTNSPFVNKFPYKIADTTDLDKEIATLNETIKMLNAMKDEKLGETVIECGKCGLQFWIKDVEYIQTHWYTQPHGCTGGDYWTQGEGQWVCKCGVRNRMFDQPEITKLKRLFKGVKDTYKD